jgi:hypothetical protein
MISWKRTDWSRFGIHAIPSRSVASSGRSWGMPAREAGFERLFGIRGN